MTDISWSAAGQWCMPPEWCELFRAHLFCGAVCSCEACAGVRDHDERAPWPGSLTSCLTPALLDRCLGTCTSERTLPRCRTRTDREATHRPASSVQKSACTSWMQDLNRYCSSTAASIPSANLRSLLCRSPNLQHDLSYTPLVISRLLNSMFSSYSSNMAVSPSSLPL